ncbi:MAG: DUF3786 domain-containing protein [Desulfobacterales bacterium]|nr:MAG: DUF3786 domain-containing protein [Desulfobacterales bacterium]
MPRIDDYINAKRIAVEALSQESFDRVLKRSGFKTADTQSFHVPFLNRTYRVGYPTFEFEDETDAGREVPLQEQVLILHFMMARGVRPVTGHWISYREIPGASFYYSAFVKRAIEPLKKVFGQNLAGLSEAAAQLNGEAIEAGDGGFEFHPLPNVPLQLILWIGDDEFPPEANILFDQNIENIFTPEDVAWLAGMVVYRLIALCPRG